MTELTSLKQSNRFMDEEKNNPYLHVVLKGHNAPITDISFNPDSATNQFASSSKDNSLMVWNIMKNSNSYSYLGHTKSINAIEYSIDGKLIASASSDCTVRFWLPTIRGNCVEFKAHLSPILCLSFSEDNSQIITGAKDKAIKLWDVATRRYLSSFLGHNHWVKTAKLFNNGRQIVSGAEDKTIRVWDVISGTLVRTINTLDCHPTYLAPYQNNHSIAAGTSSGAVRIYESRNEKMQQHYLLHTQTNYIDWHPLENYLVSCGSEGKIRIIDVMEGRPVFTLAGHEGGINCVKFSVDGEYFASGGEDKHILIWKTNFIQS